jgi:hypothetical protein
MTTCVSGSAARIWWDASMPFKLGMPISITTTSGFSFPAMATASRPSLASPTTVRSGSASTTMRRPARISVWSSASSTRIVFTR